MKTISDYNKTLNRLVTILNNLNTDSKGYSSKELADMLGVSIRTIQRDMSERLSEFPIYKDGNKWRFIEGFDLNKSMSAEDTIIVSILDKFAESIGGSFHKATKKVLSKVSNPSLSPVYIRLNVEDISDKLSEFRVLEEAIKNKAKLKCTYKFDTYDYKIDLQPLKIVNYDGFWYLLSMHGDIVKKYYLKNIYDITIGNSSFDVPVDIDNSLSIWFGKPKDLFEVKLLVKSDIVKYLERIPLCKTQKIIKSYEDGSVEISLKISHEMEILPVVKKWLPYIQLLEPIRLRESLNLELERYLEYVR